MSDSHNATFAYSIDEQLPNEVWAHQDEIVVSEDLRQRLVALGFEVAGAADTAFDAIRLAAAERPDVALMDVMLHGRPEGLDAAEHLAPS